MCKRLHLEEILLLKQNLEKGFYAGITFFLLLRGDSKLSNVSSDVTYRFNIDIPSPMKYSATYSRYYEIRVFISLFPLFISAFHMYTGTHKYFNYAGYKVPFGIDNHTDTRAL